MNIIPVTDLADPRLVDYAGVRERQLAAEFLPRSVPGLAAGGSAEAPFGKFMAEGEVVFQQLVGSRFKTLSVLCTPTRLESIRRLLETLDPELPVYLSPAAALDSLIGFHLHRGLMAIGARTAPVRFQHLVMEPGFYVILEDLTNHDNVGSIFRNAAAFGARAVLLSPRCADPLYRKSIRVSVGHALRVPYAWLDAWPADLRVLAGLGMRLAALSPRPPAIELRKWAPFAPGVKIGCLFGSEGPGLTETALGEVPERVMIPMKPGVDSLNVSATSAIVLEHLSEAFARTH